MNERKSESGSHSVVSDTLRPHGLYGPWNSPGQNIGMGTLSLFQGIFPSQESNWGLLHCRWILYQLSYQGTHCTYDGIQYFFIHTSKFFFLWSICEVALGLVALNER